jgi:hypothetical protein
LQSDFAPACSELDFAAFPMTMKYFKNNLSPLKSFFRKTLFAFLAVG